MSIRNLFCNVRVLPIIEVICISAREGKEENSQLETATGLISTMKCQTKHLICKWTSLRLHLAGLPGHPLPAPPGQLPCHPLWLWHTRGCHKLSPLCPSRSLSGQLIPAYHQPCRRQTCGSWYRQHMLMGLFCLLA